MDGYRIRGFRDPDVEPLAAVATARAVADRLPWAMSVEVFRADVLGSPGLVPERDVLVAERGDEVVGGVWIGASKRDGVWALDHEGAVHPDHRGRGVGRQLLEAIVAIALTRARELPADEPRRLTSVSEDRDPRGARLLERAGYREYRWYALMGRDLALPLPEPRPVEGIEFRPVRPEHHRALFAALEEAFRDHFGHREWTEEDFRRMVEGPQNDHSLWRVAWAGDEVVGVSRNTVDAEENAALGVRQGWVDQIGVRRPWRGRGVARLLIAETFARYRELGLARAVLGVDLDNPTGALGLYESLGFTVLNRVAAWERDLPDGPLPRDRGTADRR